MKINSEEGYGAAMKFGRKAERKMHSLAENIGFPILTDIQKQNILLLQAAITDSPRDIKPLTYFEANSGSSNPLKDDANCQSVIIAFEARRRGLNCYALPYSQDEGSSSFKLGENFAQAWINPRNMKLLQPTKITGNSDEEIVRKLEKEISVPGRYILGINYKANGHLISVDVTESCERIYHDEQDDSFINPKCFEDVEYFEVVRIDRAIFNIEMVKSVLAMF